MVLGSGGHSAEMFAILGNINTSLYTRRSYVVSFGDNLSARRAEEFEASLPEGQARTSESCVPSTYDISFIPRARAIHQSLLTTPPSALRCLAACFGVLNHPARSSDVDAGFRSDYPDLIITNGPGTAVCMIAAAFIIRFFSPILPRGLQSGRAGRGGMRTIYVESWARVKGLSLSGKLLVKVVDRFLVQWQGLQGVGGRGEYVGLLV